MVVEGSFHDGAKCRDCSVEAFDADGHKIAEGKTDKDGGFSFGISAQTDILIRMRDPVGHSAEYRMPATDLPNASRAPGTSEKTDEHDHPHSEPAHEASAAPPGGYAHDPVEIERVIEKALARQLAPIRRELEESRRRRRLSDIIGGLGYIAGLMGLILYFRSKQRQ